MSEIFCVKCGKPHTSKSQYCEFCRIDLELVIKKFREKQAKEAVEKAQTVEKETDKEQTSGIEFYQEIKEAEKRRRYDDRTLRNQLCGSITYADRQYTRDLWSNMPTVDKLLTAMFFLLGIGVVVLFFTVI
jgi:hypothetical protein